MPAQINGIIMARIKGKDIYLKNDDQIYFGSSNDAALWFDNGELQLNHTISGVAPVSSAHLTTKGYVDATIATTPKTFLNLTDTPDSYPGKTYYYAVSSTSGIEWKSDYLENEVHISSSYTGDSNGSVTNPFKTIEEALSFINTTYSGTSECTLIFHPGLHSVSEKIEINNSAIKVIRGTDSRTVVIKPTVDVLGKSFISISTPIEIINFSIDATDIPSFATTSGTVGFDILDDSYEIITFNNVAISGFYTGINTEVVSNIYANVLDINDTTTAIRICNGALFDADLLYIDGARFCHLYVCGGAEAYLGNSEISSYYVDGLVGSGIAGYVEGEDTYVEFFAGTNIWSCGKNLVVTGGAEVKVDNCVLEETTLYPGIEQHTGSRLTMVNSRAPLDTVDILIESPELCYINAFNSSSDNTTIGNGTQSNQEIFSINTGQVYRPVLRYQAVHNIDFRAISFYNPVESENCEFYVGSNEGNAAIGAHPYGSYNNTATLGLSSIQNEVRKGWNITKEAGSTPNLTIKNKDNLTAMTFDYSGNVTLSSGVSINKILDEDDFVSDDEKAVATQQSTKAYIDNYTYSSTVIDSISGTLDNNMLYADGTRDFTGTIKYDSHPTFSNNTELVDKQYVDTAVSGVEIIVQDDGTPLSDTYTTFNFTGGGVSATNSGNGVVTVSVPGITIQDEGIPIAGSPHNTIYFTGTYVSAYDLGGGVAGVWMQEPVFGTYLAWAGDESETSTNSTSPVQKARLTLSSLPEGYYRIGWYYEYNRSSISNDYMARIQIDDSYTVMEHAQEIKDNTSWYPASGFIIYQLSAGNHYIDFDHYGESTGATSYTRRLRLEFWRVE